MGKKSNIKKSEYSELLEEAQEVTKFNLTRTLEQNLKKIKLTQKQCSLVKEVNEKEIISVTGPAGSAKTFTAIYCAIDFLINNKNGKVFLCKPIVEAGEKLGFLPGEINDKIDPYLKSYMDLFEEIIGKPATKKLFDSNRITFEVAAYLRGRNLQNSFIIVDEAQNFTMSQLLTIATRKHKTSKMMFLGDFRQNDRGNFYDETDFQKFNKHVLEPIKEVTLFKFNKNDILRDKLIVEIINNFEKYKEYDKNN
jgi:phosphate starvation-inducible PhoH-like protein